MNVSDVNAEREPRDAGLPASPQKVYLLRRRLYVLEGELTVMLGTEGELRRLDLVDDARAAYQRALELVHAAAERRFLGQRLADL